MKSLGISMKWAGMIGLVVMTMGGCESKPAATDSPPVAVSKAVPAVSAEVVSQGYVAASVASDFSPGFYACDVKASELRERLKTDGGLGGVSWRYMGTRDGHHYLMRRGFGSIQVFRMVATDWQVDEPQALVADSIHWRVMYADGRIGGKLAVPIRRHHGNEWLTPIAEGGQLEPLFGDRQRVFVAWQPGFELGGGEPGWFALEIDEVDFPARVVWDEPEPVVIEDQMHVDG